MKAIKLMAFFYIALSLRPDEFGSAVERICQ
jgi:hypothetical protein